MVELSEDELAILECWGRNFQKSIHWIVYEKDNESLLKKLQKLDPDKKGEE